MDIQIPPPLPPSMEVNHPRMKEWECDTSMEVNHPRIKEWDSECGCNETSMEIYRTAKKKGCLYLTHRDIFIGAQGLTLISPPWSFWSVHREQY